MPEYDPVNYPKQTTDDLTDSEVGRDTASDTLSAWPSSNVVPDTYAGPPPAREFETSGLGRVPRDRPVPAVPAPADPGPVLPAIVPPPGHTAQP